MRLIVLATACFVFGATPLAGDELVIRELLAVNEDGLRDEDGDASDWIEVANLGATAVDARGWSLSDDASLPRKWVFPSLVIQPGAAVVVFASGKNRTDPVEELHASFRLEGDGEFLALFRPDGSVAHGLIPAFPRQRADFSYGLAMESARLAGEGSPARLLVPADGSLGSTWVDTDFVAGPEWFDATPGVGFDLGDGEGGEPAGLVSRFSFDGHLQDEAGDNDGVFVGGAPAFVTGFDDAAGGALEFDGADDHVVVAQNTDLPISQHDAFSVSLWVRGGPQPDRRVFSEGSSSNNSPVFNIGVDNTGATGRVDIFIRDAGGQALVGHAHSSGVAFDNVWRHIAWVDESGAAKLYIDGVIDPVNASYSRRATSLNRTSIGAILRASDSFHFDGAIDEVSLWKRALSPEEVAALAAGGAAGSFSRLRPLIRTDIATAMHDVNASVFLRMPFDVSGASAFGALVLRMRYDDGFVAHLNGVEVARRNTPANAVWSSSATASRDAEEALAAETFAIDPELLRDGRNVLAIHGLNSSAGDRDFLLAPELIASTGIELDSFRYFREPTPGAPNGGGFVDFVADTTFSHDRGFHDEPFDLVITSATEGAAIRYTTDGSAPDEETGTLYDGPIRVDRTTTLRAIAYRIEWEPTNVDTQTYIFLEHVLTQTAPPGYASTWGGIGADYDMDPDVVDDPRFADSIRDAFRELPSLSLVLDVDDIFGSRGIYQNPRQTGVASERPVSAEFIYPDEDIQVDAALRPMGNKARSLSNTPKIGLRLLFKGEYGPRKLRFPVFPDSPVERFDTIVVRPNYVDSWVERSRASGAQYVRDQFVRELQGRAESLTVNGVFAHLWINGLYWGIYNLTERADASFAAEHLGGDKSEYDALKTHEEVVDGGIAAYRDLQSLTRSGVTTLEDFAAVADMLDVDNMIDYMIANMFAPALDWPGNYYMVRRRADGETFKFLSWDSEEAFLEGFDVNRTQPHWRDTDSPTQFHHALRASAEYRLRFADHLHRHFFNGGMLTPERVREMWLELTGRLELALVCESARWGDYRRSVPFTPDGSWESWRRLIAEEHLPARAALVLDQFRCVPSWGGCTPLYPDIEAPALSPHGARIAADGPELAVDVDAPEGIVWYTTDGSDPRLPGGEISATATPLGGQPAAIVEAVALVRYLIPESDALGLDWTLPGFDDSAWLVGQTGVGFDGGTLYDPLINTDIQEIHQTNTSVYLRIPFAVDDPSAFTRLTLRMKYDDGFIAYLNGVRVASANAPAEPEWNSAATAPHLDSEALVWEDFDVTGHLHLLSPGGNLLAIQGLNATLTSGDMLIVPELVARASDPADDAITVSSTTLVRARALSGAEWSALAEALYVRDTPIRITELMYHPDAGELEFIELRNVGTRTVDISGLRLEGGVRFNFGEGFSGELAPGEYAVVVENPVAFEARHGDGVHVIGRYSGRLSNAGERIVLLDADGHPIHDFAYDDAWHPETDGGGSSLEIADDSAALEAWALAESWRPSEAPGGSPGRAHGDPPGPRQVPGDANQDGELNISDPVRLLRLLFIDASAATPCDGELGEGGNMTLLDTNGDASVNLSDAVFVLAYLFTGGREPVIGVECVEIDGCPEACR